MTLQRFVDAQEDGGSYATALAELRRGRKTSHWIWWVFPQLAGLTPDPSERTRYYAVRDLDEAQAYLAHPVLGPRLVEATEALDGPSAEAVVGAGDAVKLRSCLTLFAHAGPDQPVFGQVLDRWYGGVEDEVTVSLLPPRP